MIRVTIVVREFGRLKPDYSLPFDLPAIPSIGDYISIHRPDKPEPFGEDVIVRKIWWMLSHQETGGFASEHQKAGRLNEIFVECDPAVGPYASDNWRMAVESAKNTGIEVESFEVDRFSVREKDLK